MYLDNFQVNAKWRVPLAFLALLIPVAVFNAQLFHDLPLFEDTFLDVFGLWLFLGWPAGFFHTVSFLNSTVFPNADAGTTIQFWIVARLFEACTLLACTSFTHKK